MRGSSVGGFIHGASNVNFFRSYSSGNINASVYAGGFANNISADYVVECFSTGEITGNAMFISGFINLSSNTKLMKNCYSISDITTNGNGICTGLTYMVASSTEINNCYYGGKITASREAGGIAYFYHAGAKIINCHFIIHEGGAVNTAFCGDYSADGFTIYEHDIFDTHNLADQLNADSNAEQIWINIDDRLPQLCFMSLFMIF